MRPHPGSESILPNKAPKRKARWQRGRRTQPTQCGQSASPRRPARAFFPRRPLIIIVGCTRRASRCSIQGSRRRGCRVSLCQHVGTLPLEIVTACVEPEPADKTGIRVLEAESAAGGFKPEFNMAESHLFHWQGARPSSACDYVALAFLQATPCSVQQTRNRDLEEE